MNKESLLGVDIFEWDGWDDIGDGDYQFYHVNFLLESMIKYNGYDVVLNRSGFMKVFDMNEKEVWTGYVSDIPEFILSIQKGKKTELPIKFRIEKLIPTELMYNGSYGCNRC